MRRGERRKGERRGIGRQYEEGGRGREDKRRDNIPPKNPAIQKKRHPINPLTWYTQQA